MQSVFLGLVVGALLVVGLWLFYVSSPEQYANFETALATGTAVLGFGIAAAGTFKGGATLLASETVEWQTAVSTGGLVLGGAVLVLASRLFGG